MKLYLFLFLTLFLLAFVGYTIYLYDLRYKAREARNKINKLRTNKNISQDFIEFPKYYINLDRSIERKKNMEKEIETYKLKNIKRVSAFDGKKITNFREGELQGYTYKNIDDNRSRKSELAITMSHLKAIDDARTDGNENALILEDDVEFTLVPHWGKTISEIIDEMPEDCDILLLSTIEGGKEFKIVPEHNTPNGVAYIITKSGMNKLTKFLNGNEFDFHNYDEIVWDMSIISDLKIYGTNKTLFLPFNFKFGSENALDTKYQIFCSNSYRGLMNY